VVRWSTLAARKAIRLEELIGGARCSEVEVATRAQLKHKVLSSLANLNLVGYAGIGRIFHFVDAVSSLPKGLIFGIPLHLNQVDTCAFGDPNLHAIPVLCIHCHINRVIAWCAHWETLHKVQLIVVNRDLWFRAVSARDDEELIVDRRY
jgi:hypothetical protein